MTTCRKYKVIHLFEAKELGAQSIEDWLNERSELGEELIAVFENKFIFERNVYIKKITRTDGNHDKLD